MSKLLLISGSPVEESSVEILLRKTADGFSSADNTESSIEFFRLHDLEIKPCEACGESPEPEFCIFNDGMSLLYKKLIECDAMVVGSPIYFDSVSAQTKLFIDRTNCMRPGNFSQGPSGNSFTRLIHRKRHGAMVLVGGERGYYEGARKVIAGFFKWIGLINHGQVSYGSDDMRLKGSVIDHPRTLDEAFELGKQLAKIVNDQP